MTKNFKYSSLFFLISAIAWSQNYTYTYQRQLSGIDSQWHALVLPEQIFEKTAPHFNDIRILGITANKDTIEAPYRLQLAEGKREHRLVPFQIINTSSTNKGSYFTFEAPAEQEVNEIQLQFKPLDFDWKVSLEGSHDQHEWFTIISDYRIVSINTANAKFQYTTLHFPRAKYGYYRLFVPGETATGFEQAKLLLNVSTEGKYTTYRSVSLGISEEKKHKQTVIDLELPSTVPVSRIAIAVNHQFDYFRPIRIRYLADSIKTDKGWKHSYNDLSSGTLNSFQKNEFEFKSTFLKKLRVIVENHDNAPLQIDSVQVTGYVHELVARFTTPATYYLTYGAPLASKPNYDIDKFAHTIPNNLTTLALGEEQWMETAGGASTQPLFQNQWWLWGILLVLIVFMGWFALKMIRQR